MVNQTKSELILPVSAKFSKLFNDILNSPAGKTEKVIFSAASKEKEGSRESIPKPNIRPNFCLKFVIQMLS
ncbi:hypothetical protein [Microcystis aeruginosa]|uniref:hypothetical protein n=1 Tax=Microcystis aeruginosa TaxID=1126 RepID=UPI003FA3DA5E